MNQRFENLQESKPIENKNVLFEITDIQKYNAVKFAIAKCMNLFKSNRFDTPSSSMKNLKEQWKEITIREKWNEKK